MRAYKFLAAGAIAPFSRRAWPLPDGDRPGGWVEGERGAAALCRTAVHGCRVADLPWWLQEQLWEAEFAGPIATARHKIMAPGARLVRRIEAWDAGRSQAFADACAWRARDHAVRALERAGAPAGAAQLHACPTPAALLEVVEDLQAPPDARLSVTMAGHAAIRAIQGATATAAYIAAHLAARVDGPSAMGQERAWQAEWLRSELGLQDDSPV
jgi:hypothetical protein